MLLLVVEVILINVQVSYDEDGCYSKNDYFYEDNKYELYQEVTIGCVSDQFHIPSANSFQSTCQWAS